MKRRSVLILICMTILLGVAAHCMASEGAGGSYTNEALGISFTIPNGFSLYTLEKPGPLAGQISKAVPVILVNTAFSEENITMQVLENISDADIDGYKKMLDENPVMQIPQYKRVKADVIKIGNKNDKKAVLHVFTMKGNILGKIYQLTFEHKGNGFIFTCATAVDRYEKTSNDHFIPLFTGMEFK